MPETPAPPLWGHTTYRLMAIAVLQSRADLRAVPTDYDAQIAALMALRASVETAIMHTARQATLHAALPEGRGQP